MAEGIDQKIKLIIVTGLSGAGRTVAIHALEDNGFYCIDNLPVAILSETAKFIKEANYKRCAFGMDIRDTHFISNFSKIKENLSKDFELHIVFLSADEDVLVSRYVSNRRKHPLLETGGELLSAVRREKHLLEKIEHSSDTLLDTSTWSPHQLSRQMEDLFCRGQVHRKLYVSLISFGFKYGPLKPADSIFDVRFLDNPHFVAHLKDRTGLDLGVKNYIRADQRSGIFLKKLVELHHFLLPNYYQEGKHYFRIGIGCTGGKHRSVYIAEELGLELAKLEIEDVLISVSHRDMNEFNPLER